VSDNVFIQPLNLSHFVASPPGDSPGFTQLVHDVLGDGASPVDGFDAALSDTTAAVDLLDQALGQQDAALDAVLVSLAATNPAPLDQSMAGYASTISTGAGLVNAAQQLTPPDLLTLPISITVGGPAGGTPAQKSIDLGTHHVGDAPWSYQLGAFGTGTGAPNTATGIIFVTQTHGDPAIFALSQTITREINTDRYDEFFGYYTLDITPAAAGVWIARAVR
jgi:hypothetical protein